MLLLDLEVLGGFRHGTACDWALPVSPAAQKHNVWVGCLLQIVPQLLCISLAGGHLGYCTPAAFGSWRWRLALHSGNLPGGIKIQGQELAH
jgi:hypothetical protein